jgi:hypothetical protein
MRVNGTTPIKPRGVHERTYQRILGMLAYHEVVQKQGRVTLEITGQISIVPNCGGNAEIGWLAGSLTTRGRPDGKPCFALSRLLIPGCDAAEPGRRAVTCLRGFS